MYSFFQAFSHNFVAGGKKPHRMQYLPNFGKWEACPWLDDTNIYEERIAEVQNISTRP